MIAMLILDFLSIFVAVTIVIYVVVWLRSYFYPYAVYRIDHELPGCIDAEYEVKR